MTIQKLLDLMQEAENLDIWEVSTQTIKRHLEGIQREQLKLNGVGSNEVSFKGFINECFERWLEKYDDGNIILDGRSMYYYDNKYKTKIEMIEIYSTLKGFSLK